MRNLTLSSIMLFCLSIGTWGCGSYSTISETCKGVTCSGHGICQTAGEVAVCICEQGWSEDPINPMTCVESNSSFVVDLVTNLSDPAGNRITVTFKTESPVILVMGSDLANVWHDMLKFHWEQQKAIAADINPLSREILDVYLPLESPVAYLVPIDEGIEVELFYSAAIHMLLRSHPRFQAFSAFLEAALNSGQEVMLTETDTSHEVIDVRSPIQP